MLEPAVSGQQDCDRFPGAGRAVVDEHDQRLMAKGFLSSGVLLLGVRQDQYPVELQNDLAVGGRTVCTGQLPISQVYFVWCRADCGQGFRAGCGKDVDETADGRAGGHRVEDVGLGPQQGDIGQAVSRELSRAGGVVA